MEQRLIERLRKAAPTAKEAYWKDQDAILGSYVSKSGSVEVWREFHRYLERADLGMRMELINHLHPSKEAPPEILDSFFAIYELYGEDRTVRDETSSEKFSGPGAGFPHMRIEVRDFIHCHWGGWLDVEEEEPEEGATAEQWARYRATVEAAVGEFRKALRSK